MSHSVRLARQAAMLAALVTMLLSGVLSAGPQVADAAGTVTLSASCALNLRTTASTAGAIRATVRAGTVARASTSVAGGRWRATCAGRSVSGYRWYRITAIGGRSVLSLYGRSYLYAATGLFRVVTVPAATPTPSPTPSPSATPTPSPSVTPAPAPTATPAPSASPTPTPAPTLAAACGVNVRTGASTSYAIRTTLAAGTGITAAATVSGGSWSTPCAGATVSGSTWYRISAIGGRTVSSLYGVSYLYAATGLFARLAAPVSTPGTTLGDMITFYGRGWGHGVGMSQYGARGRALAGQTAATILAHYYQGTTIGTLPATTVRVLVLDNFAATASSPLIIYGRGGTWTIDGITTAFPADARLRLVPVVSAGAAGWQLVVDDGASTVLYTAPTTGNIRVRPAAAGTLLQVWSKPSSFDRYRGSLHVIATTTVDVVDEVPMESYLRGVVPVEMPSSWPAEALRAQAIAARSYAAYHLRSATSTFDVYDDTRSQVYRGALAEVAPTDAAVAATSGRVLRSGTAIANAMFHSTAGGATENNENVYVSPTGARVAGAVSYLRGSSDRAPDGTPYDASSPYATWHTATYTRSALSAIFAADARTNVGTLVSLQLSNRGVSGRLISVTLVGATGTTATVSGDVFVAVFNAHRPAADPMLRSTLLDIRPIP